ncbi:MAG: hypothetical protein ACREDS_01195 [Limisphaerales bacterium]
MRTNIPEKLLKIADDIAEQGSANLTRLAVLKKWFEKPERLSAFAIWVASRATSRKGKTGGTAAELFREARTLLAGVDNCHPELNRKAAETLHNRLCDFQDEYQNQQWGPVRIVHNWNLMLVEHALAIYLWHSDSPADGYKLAADYCQHYDPRYGNGLNGPSRTKIGEIVRFMFNIEALEGVPE